MGIFVALPLLRYRELGIEIREGGIGPATSFLSKPRNELDEGERRNTVSSGAATRIQSGSKHDVTVCPRVRLLFDGRFSVAPFVAVTSLSAFLYAEINAINNLYDCAAFVFSDTRMDINLLFHRNKR